MPFVANTPESRLGRSDSKDPNATCRAITSSGRPCRRAITVAQPPASLRPHARAKTPDPSDEALYCWQHKEQAGHASTRSSPGPIGRVHPILEERSSLDTLADRLGLVDLQEKAQAVKQSRAAQGRTANGRTAAVQRPPVMTRPKPAKTLDFCFCFSIPLDEVNEPLAPRPRPQAQPVQHASAPVPSSGLRYKQQLYQQQHQQQQQYLSAGSPRRRVPDAASSPSKSSHRSAKSTTSQTAQMKHLIPDTLDTATASALMAELARPYADSEEPGYIYMFWLTPVSQSTPPPVAAARSLLAPPSPSSNRPVAARTRRASDVVSSFANQQNLNPGTTPKTGSGKTMLLKIGRAANVQRRMNQWQRQCGYDIEMLRYYPYHPDSSSTPSPSPSPGGTTPRTTPHCRRVERLIHIELAGLALRADLATCGACGRDHREWFEVDASREGIRRVNDVVRRWVEWDERAG